MYRKVEVAQETSKLILNYHKHPETGGVGHVSMEVTHQGKVMVLSVYPTEELSPLTPIAVTTMYIFPTKAVNHREPSQSDSPIHSSYDVTPHIEDMDAVLVEMERLHNVMESGCASFSLTPSAPVRTTTAILNCNTSTSNMLYGLKFMDRTLIDNEIEKVEVLNCAESISKVLEAGGMQRPEGLLSFATPSGINSHFASLTKTEDSPETLPEQRQETAETPPERNQPESKPTREQSISSPQEESVGFFRGMFHSVRDYFSSSSETKSRRESRHETSTIDSSGESPSDNFSSSTDDRLTSFEPERVEEAIEPGSPSQELNSREENSASPRASECSESFFAQSEDTSTQIEAQRANESDLNYCSRYESMVN